MVGGLVSTWGTSGHDQTTKLASVFKFGIQLEYRWCRQPSQYQIQRQNNEKQKCWHDSSVSYDYPCTRWQSNGDRGGGGCLLKIPRAETQAIRLYLSHIIKKTTSIKKAMPQKANFCDKSQAQSSKYLCQTKYATKTPHYDQSFLNERGLVQMWHLKDIFEHKFFCEMRSRMTVIRSTTLVHYSLLE